MLIHQSPLKKCRFCDMACTNPAYNSKNRSVVNLDFVNLDIPDKRCRIKTKED
jgi:hypothetical protein